MKILSNGQLKNASSLVTTNPSLNYPVKNLYHDFLGIRYQGQTAGVQTITADFASNISIDCFALGEHNVQSLKIITPVKTIDFIPQHDTDMLFFDKIENINQVQIEATPAPGEKLRIGGLDFGEYIETSDVQADFEYNPIDNSIASESLDGQTLQNYIEPLRSYSFGFRGKKMPEIKNIIDEYKLLGVGKNMWFYFFDSGLIDPMYGKIISPVGWQKNGLYFSTGLEIKESR